MFEALSNLVPQSILIVAACGFFLGGAGGLPRKVWGPAALGVFGVAAACLWMITPGPAFPGSAILNDALAQMFQWVALLVGVMFALLAVQERSDDPAAPEFYGLLLTLIAGLMLVPVANELVLLFLSLELISVPTYILLYLGRRDYAAQESAVKYFLLSVLSAAVLLYGFAFLYGLTGTTNLGAIRNILAATYDPDLSVKGSTLGIVALVLIFAGLGFKIAAVPFHFYAPDVYQGTTAWNAGLLAVAPKLAGIVALVRVGSETMVGFEGHGVSLALILALFTMTVGNTLALWQTNVRRMLAYSSIAHAGYMLMGLAVGFWDAQAAGSAVTLATGTTGLPGGVQACLFYVIAYVAATTGLFSVLIYLGRPGKSVEHLEDLTGLVRTQPWVALAAALFLFSLAGIPPLPGFWAKLTIFASALGVHDGVHGAVPLAANPQFVVLAIVGALNAAIGAVYYLRLVAIMFLQDPLGTWQPAGGKTALGGVYATAIVTLLLGLQTRPLLDQLRRINTLPPSAPAEVTQVNP